MRSKGELKPRHVAPLTIILPSIASIVLFSATIFVLVLPAFEKSSLTRRRELIRELTQTVWTTLAQYEQRRKAGELTLEQAQAHAVDYIHALRYGPDHKDYFWINDLHPRMIAHPYRPDLIGRDLSEYRDSNGKKLFLEFTRVARQNGAGFVDYMWQWKDDPTQIVPKVSHVRLFKPWGWIIGTGIYIEDVKQEIALMTRKLTVVCLEILGFVAILLTYIIWQGTRAETHRRLTEQKIRQREAELAHLSRLGMMSELASGLAHELNQPLYAVLGCSEVCLRMLKSDTGDRRQIIETMQEVISQAERAGDIIKSVRRFVRREAPERHKVKINDILNEVAGLIEVEAKRKNVTMRVEQAVTDPVVMADDVQIEQVLLNLAQNALEAMESTPRDQRAILLKAHAMDGQKIELSVSDNGVGLPTEKPEQVFEPFFSTKSSGLGIGLSLSRTIVEAHGGRLHAGPNHGRGTIFKFTLTAC